MKPLRKENTEKMSARRGNPIHGQFIKKDSGSRFQLGVKMDSGKSVESELICSLWGRVKGRRKPEKYKEKGFREKKIASYRSADGRSRRV